MKLSLQRQRIIYNILLFLLLIALDSEPNKAQAPGASPLLISEIVVTPTGGEFIEIYNPGDGPVNLSNVYLTDATHAKSKTYYYNIVTGTKAGGGNYSDFHARFPDGATIGPKEYQTIALNSSFSSSYNVDPTYELYGDSTDNILDMREAFSGSIMRSQPQYGTLTNNHEVIILYYWDGTTDLVTDLDYVVWGNKAEAVDKSRVAIDGPDADSSTTAYKGDTAALDQDVISDSRHGNDKSWQRRDYNEGTEETSGGNGVAGHDETSENLGDTFCEERPTPNAESACPNNAAPTQGPPSVRQTNPVDGNSIVETGNITITFSKPVTLSGDWFTMVCGANTYSVGNTNVTDTHKQTFTLDPQTDLVEGASCRVTILASQVEDQDGNGLPSDYVFSFTVVKACSSQLSVHIYDLQENGARSGQKGPFTVEGVVVGDFQALQEHSRLKGFYLQAATGDGNLNTSDGIFVFDGGNPALGVSVGDVIRVTGTVSERHDQTQISASSIEACSTTATIAPLPVTLPIVDWERYEGMLIQISGENSGILTVTDTYNLGKHGEITVSSSGRLYNPLQIHPPGSAEARELKELNNRNVIIIDDDRDGELYQDSLVPFMAKPSDIFRQGFTTPSITGVLGYGFGKYRLRTTVAPIWTPANPRSSAPEDTGGKLTVASFNLLNYFNGDDAGSFHNSRGAKTAEEFALQAPKLVSAICAMNADIVGLMELENDNDDSSDGISSAIETLVSRLNAVPNCGPFSYIQTGILDADGIRVGLIYKPGSVTPVGNPVAIPNTAPYSSLFYGKNTSRVPVAQTFKDTQNAVLTVVVNHFKSKGCREATGPNANQHDGQSCWNNRRTESARALLQWLATDPTGSNDPDILILGDLNAYAQEDPIKALTDNGYVDLAAAHSTADPLYSYVYFGEVGTLDYAFGSPSLARQVTGATIWHINTDEPRIREYQKTVYSKKPPEKHSPTYLYESNAFRSSDHDPVIVGLELIAPIANDDPTYTVASGGTLTIAQRDQGILANDTDPDTGTNAGLTIVGGENTNLALTPVEAGTLHLKADGTFTYTAPGNFAGEATFTYQAQDTAGAQSNVATVTITVTNPPPANQAPTANNDPNYTVASGSTLTVTQPAQGVLANDTDPDTGNNTGLTIVGGENTNLALTPVEAGTLHLKADGTFTYTAPGNFAGEATFTYQAQDTAGAQSNVATVTITVTNPPPANQAPTANNDPNYTVASGSTLTVTQPAQGILANDTDPDTGNNTGLTIVGGENTNLALTPVEAGTLHLKADGTFTYTAPGNFAGEATFTYQAQDTAGAQSNVATVTITVTNSAPPTCSMGNLPVQPTLSWQRPADQTDPWYQLLLWNKTTETIVFDEWVANTICTGQSCNLQTASYLPEYGLLNGVYELYIRTTSDGNTFSDWTVVAPHQVNRAAPQLPDVTNIQTQDQGRAQITLPRDDNALYYQVYIGKQDNQQHLQWYRKHHPMCCGNTCTFDLDFYLLNGQYVLYVRAWGPAGLSTGGIQGWGGPFNFEVNDPAPTGATDLNATLLANGKPQFGWTAPAHAPWYNFWVGTISSEGEATTAYTTYLFGRDLKCVAVGQACVFEPDIDLAAGSYSWYVLAIGPGGNATGGWRDTGWVEGPALIKP